MRKLFTFLLALFALTAMADKVVFHEDFSACKGDAPNKTFIDSNSKSFVSSNFTIKTHVYQGNECVRLGTSSKIGVLTTRKITDFGTTPVNGKLTFKAAPWGTDLGTVIKVKISGAGDLSEDGINFVQQVSTTALTSKQWKEFTFHIKGATSATQLTFTYGSRHKRFFLDDILVTAKIAGSTESAQELSFASSALTYVLGSAEYAAANNQTAPAVMGAKTTVTYTSNKPAVADIVGGKLVLGTAGTATITATAAAGVVDGVTYFEASASYTITIIPTITLPLAYDGNASGLEALGFFTEKIGKDYQKAPHIKFDKDGSKLTFYLPHHNGVTLWFNQSNSNNPNKEDFTIETSIDGRTFTNALRTEVQFLGGSYSVRRYAVSIPAGVLAVKMAYHHNGSPIGIGAFHIAEAVPVTITDAKYATFMAGSNVYLPPAVKACIVEAKGNGIKVKELVDQVVNANVPVLLQGEAGTYAAEPDVTATESSTFAGNLLKGSLTTTTIAAPVGHKLYVLNKGSKGVGFYWEMGTAGNSVNLQAGHAYLSLPISGGAAQGFSLDTPTVTGVEAVETIPSEDALIYDLSGRRVMTPTHGIYIVGGKKVLK